MQLVKAKRKPIVVEVEGAKLTFGPASHQDIVFAANVLRYVASAGAEATPVPREQVIKHVFSKLRSVEGVKSDGIDLTVEDLRDTCLDYDVASLAPILNGWAGSVLIGEGVIKPRQEAEGKNAPTSNPETPSLTLVS